jgi:hypothetical protein
MLRFAPPAITLMICEDRFANTYSCATLRFALLYRRLVMVAALAEDKD